MANSSTFVGVDVSKTFLDVGVLNQDTVRRVSNTPAGIRQLVRLFKASSPQLIVCEATGGLERALVLACTAADLPITSVNARHVRHFAKAIGKLAKTDRIDALVLARFAAAVQPKVRALPDELVRRLAALGGRRRQLKQMMTAERNRLSSSQDALVDAQIHDLLALLTLQAKQVTDEMLVLVRADVAMRHRYELLISVPGVGDVVALNLLSSLPELGRLSRTQVAALVGVAPINRDSGASRGRRMTWGGRAEVRTMLYMATVVACRHNAVIKPHYEQLVARGKPKMVALVACMRKLLVCMNAMLRDDLPWQAAPG